MIVRNGKVHFLVLMSMVDTSRPRRNKRLLEPWWPDQKVIYFWSFCDSFYMYRKSNTLTYVPQSFPESLIHLPFPDVKVEVLELLPWSLKRNSAWRNYSVIGCFIAKVVKKRFISRYKMVGRQLFLVEKRMETY